MANKLIDNVKDNINNSAGKLYNSVSEKWSATTNKIRRNDQDRANNLTEQPDEESPYGTRGEKSTLEALFIQHEGKTPSSMERGEAERVGRDNKQSSLTSPMPQRAKSSD